MSAANGEPRPSPTDLVVLLVEDEVLQRWALAQDLRRAGWKVIEAANVKEALSILRAGTSVSIIFTDIHMPGPMTGLDLVAVVRVEFPGIPCVVTSSDLPDASLLRGCPFIAKPVVSADLDIVLRGELSGDE